MATKEFKCTVCGYVHKGDKAPDKCPVCQAPADKFEEVTPEAPAKKGLNTNSNVYTIVYAAVMVILVAFLLVFVSSVLKERQDANVKNDTKKQILSALNITDVQDVAATYAEVIKGDFLMAENGKPSEQVEEADFKTSYKTEFDEGRLHIFVAEVDGKRKFIIPMNGLGLWGPIWGYIALNDDRNTVYGTYFSHQGETPGLGAEIAAEYFQNRFIDKNVVKDGNIALTVTKSSKAVDAQYEVDGVTAATMTSNGVNNMIKTVLAEYMPFLTKACCKEHQGACEDGSGCCGLEETECDGNHAECDGKDAGCDGDHANCEKHNK